MVAQARLFVRLLGRPEVVNSLGQPTPLPSRGLCLVALLATNPGYAMGRAHAAAQLWESRDTQTSLANMRQLLFRVARAMPGPDSIIEADDKTIRISKPEAVDVCRFLDLQELGSERGARQLLSLYRGDLLQDVLLGDFPSEEPFTTARTYLRERFFSFANTAIAGLTRYGHADTSLLLDLEQRALAVDNGREETYRALIAAYGAVGRSDEARRLFGQLTEVLRQDGSGAPDPATRASFVRATVRAAAVRPARKDPEHDRHDGIDVPRVALLAPAWEPGVTDRNFLRAFVEDAANELARYPSVTALAAHSSFGVASDGGLIDDNSQLRADYAVTSFARPAGEKLTVRLTNNRSGAIVWAADYPLAGSAAVSSNQTLVARIVAALATAVAKDSLYSAERTQDPSAYVTFLRGQQALKTSDLRSVRRARRLFGEALSCDDRFADAYSGAACSLYVEWLLLGGNDPRLLSEARELADLAIAYDPGNSAGYWRRAMVALYQHHFDDTQRFFEMARERHPNSANVLIDQGDAMGFLGDPDAAWQMFEQALDLNPTPPDHYWWAGASIAFSQADFSKVIALCGNLASDEPVLRLLAASHGQLGNRVEARSYGDRLKEAYPGETAESMTRLQPHRSKASMQPFIDGLRAAGIK